MAGTRARLCLCLTAPTLDQDLELAARYRSSVDLLELRADFLQPGEWAALARFPQRAGLPAILTLRRPAEGGHWPGREGQRLRLLARALGEDGVPYAFVDLEEDLRDAELETRARERGTRVIRSVHDLSGVPRGLPARLRRLARAPGELPKAAVLVRGSGDLLRLFRAYRELEGLEKILLGMGEYGLPTRVLAGRLGSWLTYCSPAGDSGQGPQGVGGPPAGSLPSAAPGHLSPEAFLDLYRFRRIDRETALFGVIGNPIAHSRSPELHNRGYAALGLNAVYLPFRVDRLGPFLRAAELLGVQGLSVTVPFKREVIRRLAGAADEVRAIGACNTLLRRGSGWWGANTDAAGFLEPLERQAPELLRPGAGATVLGAGGAARAVVYALASRGLRVLVLNRTAARARALARRFGCAWGGLDARGVERMRRFGELIVQSTTVGMAGSPDRVPGARGSSAAPRARLEGAADPLPEYDFKGTELVYDLVYSPPLTPLLARAQAAGCRTIGGMSMLEAQARAQFRLFTGQDYPQGAALYSCRPSSF
jgi:3-dehydroquinate dehydratase/shikimate dehydrogenase